jgi:hypothetical protein
MKKLLAIFLFVIVVSNSWAIDPATAKLFMETIAKIKIKSLDDTEVDVAFYDIYTKADGDGNLLKSVLFTTSEGHDSKTFEAMYPMTTYFGSVPDVDTNIKAIMIKDKKDVAFYKLDSDREFTSGKNEYKIYQGYFCTWDKKNNKWVTEIYILIYGTWFGGDYIINNFGGGGWPNYDKNGNIIDEFW